MQRGNLDDHLKYRCSGTLVACQYAGAGCDFRGPKKAMTKHHGDCKFKKQGKHITTISYCQIEHGHTQPLLYIHESLVSYQNYCKNACKST